MTSFWKSTAYAPQAYGRIKDLLKQKLQFSYSFKTQFFTHKFLWIADYFGFFVEIYLWRDMFIAFCNIDSKLALDHLMLAPESSAEVLKGDRPQTLRRFEFILIAKKRFWSTFDFDHEIDNLTLTLNREQMPNADKAHLDRNDNKTNNAISWYSKTLRCTWPNQSPDLQTASRLTAGR